MKLFSGIILTLLLASMLMLACNIQPVEGEPETRCAYNNGQGTVCDDQTSQRTSASRITSSDGSIGEVSDSDRLEVDYESGRICIDEYLLYKAWRVFDSCSLPAEYALSPGEAQFYARGGTTVIQEIKENWNNLSPETQKELGFVFKRPTDVGGGIDGERHLLPKLYNTTNFIVHWTNGTDDGSSADAVPLDDINENGVPDYVEDFAAIFENVRGFEVTSRGFHAPPDDSAQPDDANRRNPDQRYDVFIYNMSAYGYTNKELYPNSSSYSFIGVDNDYVGFSTLGLAAMQVTAAHEFNHAIQFYYDCLEETWWMEATATYMEDEVYPDVNDNYQYLRGDLGGDVLLPDWFQFCDSGLEWSDNWHWYGDFIFVKRLSEDFGDDVIKEIWEEMKVTNGTVAIDNALVRRGSSFVNEFRWFTIANFFLEKLYVDGTDYRRVLTESPMNTFNGVRREYEYDASFEPDYFVIDAKNVNYDAWMDRWATDYVTIKLDPTIKNYRIFFDGLDLTTDYLVTMVYKKDGNILGSTAILDAQKDRSIDCSYDPTIENLTLIISNVGNTATEDPSWRVVITKLLPQMELYYDDGTFETTSYWLGPGGRFAVRFTPTTSGRLTECSFYIGLNPAPVKVHVMDSFKNDLITPFLKTPMFIGWLHVDLSGFQVPVSSGVDFYIAVEWTVANAPWLGFDTSNPDGRSWSYNGAEWSQRADRDYGIRAIVANESPDFARADLIILDIFPFDPSSNPMEGNTVTFAVNIKNRGPVDAGSFKTAYYIDGSKIGEWSISSLPAGKGIIGIFTWTAVQGNHTLKAFADSSYNVDEKVEINNEREKAFQVVPTPKPDLIISDISWVPGTPVNGDTVTFNVTIKNNGTADAGSFKTAYYINQTKLGEWSITSLSVGQEVNKTFTWTYVEGSHIIKAIADSNGEIQEEDETNNVREEVIGNRPPVALFRCNGFNYLSNPVAFVHMSTCFNATESYDPDGSIASYSWDFGDGNKTTLSQPLINHTYTNVGNYSVILNVTDNQGLWNTTTSLVTVENITLPGDVNSDGTVDIYDALLLAAAINSKPGTPTWNPNADFNGDNIVDIYDAILLANNYGKTA